MATSHHGDGGQSERPNPAMEKIMQRFIEQTEGRAKREYPHGRVKADDDGALAYAVTADKAKGIVVIDFGKPVEWIGLRPDDIAKLVQVLIARAREVATEPFSVIV